jgi:tetratricopeptide (TPR) repeat protein
MEQAARPGTVLIAPATRHLVEGFVAVKSLGPVPVKGRSKPVEVYELSGIGPARTRLQAAARRGLTRFVGRDAEIEVLRRSLERAGPGHGQVVAIVGEAGVGKSRLVREFTRSQRTDGWLVLESGSVSYGRTTPYLPVIELLVETIGERLADAPLQIAAQYYLAAASHLSGDYRGTEHRCRQLMQSLRGQRTRERFGLVASPAVWSRAQLARALAERGVFDEGDAQGRESIRIAEALDHPFSVVVGCLELAYLKTIRGELSQAAGLIERALAQCREWNTTSHTPIATASLGHVYAWSGRIEEGLSCLQQALTAYEVAGIVGFHHSLSVEQLAEAYLLADQVENARAGADRAVMLARGRGERGYEAWALRLLGDIASHHARPDVTAAAAHYGAAMTLAFELDMRPLVAHCHFGLGRLYRRRGDADQAQEYATWSTVSCKPRWCPSWTSTRSARVPASADQQGR